MSEQAKILAKLEEVIVQIMQSRMPTEADADTIDALEELLFQQKSFQDSESENYVNKGEEIASLFFEDKYVDGIKKMKKYAISPEDFFGFISYYYDEDHEDEKLAEKLTQTLQLQIQKDYDSN